MAFQKNSKNDSNKSADSSDESDSECEYDSTWENEEIDRTKRSRRRWSRRNLRAAEDMWNYRHNYPGRKMDNDLQNTDQPNLQFYRNKRPSSPDGVYIDGFHNQWWGDYDKLEWVHSYIQWLFPIEEDGMNYSAFKLTKAEIKSFQKDEDAKERLLKSYQMMLDFYGIKLVDEETGKVERADNWEDRFDNLNRNTNNNLRITHILKCLGTLGFQHYQAPLVRFFLTETLVKKTLPRVKSSVLDYFMFAVLDKDERRELVKYAFKNFEPKGDFVWCPKWIQKRFLEEYTQKETRAKDSDEAIDMESNSNKDTPGNTEVKQMNVQEDNQEEPVQGVSTPFAQ
ncbi:opioid growth factor receptor-like protein 1 [Chanos chanos]|uniref:Opioid growth factor receptor-like protein 1 n=1 Tax=Chanos chanos TaxID=29144 RepID=A0A6J2VQ87_CHACN|nr:opioid growth factor receptor-like protein 1 [Chanos chanos]